VQSRQGNRLQSLRAVEEFLAANHATLDEVVNTGTRRQFAKAVAALDVIVAEQEGSSVVAQGGTRRYRALRQALLRDHMAPIALIARAALVPAPEMEALRMPKHNWSAERLAAAAHGMAQAAAPFAADFVTAGLRAGFIERLAAAADAMVQSVSDRVQTRGRLTGATKGLAATLASARKLVDVIDALVKRALPDDSALLASWKRVKRVRQVASRAAAEAGAVAPAVQELGTNAPYHDTIDARGDSGYLVAGVRDRRRGGVPGMPLAVLWRQRPDASRLMQRASPSTPTRATSTRPDGGIVTCGARDGRASRVRSWREAPRSSSRAANAAAHRARHRTRRHRARQQRDRSP
jgi:hypothetical protein